MLRVLENDRPAAPATGPDGRVEAVARACRYIEARVDGTGGSAVEADPGTVTLAELGRHCGISPWHLQRLFKRVVGVSPRQYADARRLKRFKAGLQQGDGVAAATYDAGYGSSSRVYERAAAALGMTPATYAKGGQGTRIAYAIAPSPLGHLLVAATERGICFVTLGCFASPGEGEGKLEAKLRREFPAAAEVRRDDEALGGIVRAILNLIDGEEPHVDLPLDLRATAFQRRVWEELRRIPMGETRSYGEIARALGQPTAQRAVANACASNPVPVIVPCHRVVRSNGAIGGYRLGVERKRKLLEQEATTHEGE